MEYDGVIFKPSLDEYFEHHGVKGMHWGVRKAVDTVKGVGKTILKRPNAKARVIPTTIARNASPYARKVASLTTTVSGTVGNKSINYIAGYNSLSSRAKRGYKAFRGKLNQTLRGKNTKKVTLSQLSNHNKSTRNMYKLATGATQKFTKSDLIKGKAYSLGSQAKSVAKNASHKATIAKMNAGIKANRAMDKGAEKIANGVTKLVTGNGSRGLAVGTPASVLSSINQLDDYTAQLLKKNGRRLAGW